MPYPKITTMYECSKCRKLYTKIEDAEKCEESHKCDCEKGFKYYRLGYLEPEYDSYVSSNINWEEKKFSSYMTIMTVYAYTIEDRLSIVRSAAEN